jgi:8-oxo-dGTP diphosphatase
VEQGEDLIAALVRETVEESGCEVVVERLVAVYSRLDSPAGVVFMFRGRLLAGSACAANETVDAGWFSVEEARERVTHPPNAARLRDALAGHDRPVYRSYTVDPYATLDEWSL